MMTVTKTKAALLIIGMILAIAYSYPKKAETLADKWGVEIVSIQTSAAGHIIDFRYRVIDAEKAAPLLDRRIDAFLVDQETQATLIVPRTAKVGPLRQTLKYGKPRERAIYFVLFGNPGNVIASGDKVSVVIGDFRAENLVKWGQAWHSGI